MYYHDSAAMTRWRRDDAMTCVHSFMRRDDGCFCFTHSLAFFPRCLVSGFPAPP